MPEEDIQNVLQLGEEKEAHEAKTVEKWDAELQDAVKKVADFIASDKKKSSVVLEIRVRDSDVSPEVDAYEIARGKLYKFLGVSDQRPSDQELVRLESQHVKIEDSGREAQMYPDMQSPLGFTVNELHDHVGNAGSRYWHNEQGVILRR